MAVKINSLELENVKRIKAVKIEPTKNGLTIVGGKNNQGKTSVLDSIAWALGGDRFKPTSAQRDGSVIPPHLKITLDNGIIVERTGKNSSLKVIDPNGYKSGQQLLNEFVEQLAIDLPKFMHSSSKDKANTLLKIIGVGDTLYKLDDEEQRLYNQRRAIGQIADQKAKYAREMPVYTGLPSDPVSASELIKQQQDILAKNGENQRLRDEKQALEEKANTLQIEIDAKSRELTALLKKLETARKTTATLHDESTVELEQNIAHIDDLNQKIRANLDREKAEIEAEGYKKQYDDLSNKIDDIRKERIKLLDSADMPLDELSIDNGELVYKGFKWDNMSGSDQLKVATAIIRKLNPKCGFVLLDQLEQMDIDTLAEFSKWLEQEGLQAIATRVSTGDECSIIIEDGYSYDMSGNQTIIENTTENNKKTWKAGEF